MIVEPGFDRQGGINRALLYIHSKLALLLARFGFDQKERNHIQPKYLDPESATWLDMIVNRALIDREG